MKRERGRLAGCIGFLLIAALVLPGTGGAASSPDWKNCGLLHYQADRYVHTEARGVGCTKARQVARVVANHPGKRYCPNAGTCHIAGFTCLIDTFRDKVLCTRDREPLERIRMRGVSRHR